MNFKSAMTLVLVTGVVASGCGGGGDKGSAAAKPDPAKSAQADATAKSNARYAVTEIESCFVDAATYSGCKVTPASVEVTNASATGYTLTASSTEGNSFVITKGEAGTLSRTCTTKGEGGCPAAGTW